MTAQELQASARALVLQARPTWQEVATYWIAAKVRSENTRRAYARALGRFFTTSGRMSVADVTAADLELYCAMLREKGHAPKTQAQAIAALRSFFRWARKQRDGRRFSPLSVDDLEDALQMPKAKVQRPYSVLNAAEIQAVKATAETPRDRALLGVLIGCGLRVSEVAELAIEDVHRRPSGRGWILVRGGKGGKDRRAPVPLSVMEEVRAYLAATGRTLRSEGPLFRAHDRGAAKRERRPMSPQAIANVVRVIVRRSGVLEGVEADEERRRISPHSLRHTFAVQFLRMGGQVHVLQQILGHSSLATTMIYVAHLDFEELVETAPDVFAAAAA